MDGISEYYIQYPAHGTQATEDDYFERREIIAYKTKVATHTESWLVLI